MEFYFGVGKRLVIFYIIYPECLSQFRNVGHISGCLSIFCPFSATFPGRVPYDIDEDYLLSLRDSPWSSRGVVSPGHIFSIFFQSLFPFFSEYNFLQLHSNKYFLSVNVYKLILFLLTPFNLKFS